MMDLIMRMNLELYMKLLWMELWMVVDDDCGWIGESRRWKKVGISSLSKKVMIRQARADYALVEIHLFDVLELSIRFCDLVGLIFVRREHEKEFKKSRFWSNQNSPRLSDCQNPFFSSNVEL